MRREEQTRATEYTSRGLLDPGAELASCLTLWEEFVDLENKLRLLRSSSSACRAIAAVLEESNDLAKESLALRCDETRIREALAEAYGLAAESRLLKNFCKDLAEGECWSWPVRIIESGWSEAHAVGKQLEAPLYFPPEIMPQIARAAEGARFRRRHPSDFEDKTGDDEHLLAGWISEARVVEESPARFAVYGTVNLSKDERALRGQLMAARDDRRLDLFGVSHDAIFNVKRAEIEGRPALVATSLKKLIGVDMCTGTPSASGGRFLGSVGAN